ncbi:MAG TPA: bifunctional serine/threonine-protein kinase/formylglycine-generating enzyme family protein [Phycisphaerales bacterium]|nr:bifunctional serine/threonine-protein kinase/formylglycine-generating enzyme family protein [Phycisphaerales bacterium]
MAAPWDEKSVFLAAAALNPQDREAFLEGACPSEDARRRIRALLAMLEDAPTQSDQTSSPVSPRPTPTSPGELLPSDPRRIDEFNILRRIGKGGMGVVYLAEDTSLQRQVAIKVLASHLTESDEALGRFRDEAKTAARLRNPGIVSVYKFGHDGSRHYIVSEYVAGYTLKEFIAQEIERRDSQDPGHSHRRSWNRRLAELCALLAEALEYSHRSDIVHRDVKPSNILMDADGRPRLTDFGIAKVVAFDTSMQVTEQLGSCHYMSPEQAAVKASRIDRRSDIFSLGVVLYEAITLRRPFDGPTPEQVLDEVRSKDPLRPRAIDRTIPPDLETICLKALEKSPERRYQSAMHMAADLRSFLAGDPILARPASVVRKTGRWISRNRTVAGACAAGLLLCIIALLAYSRASMHRAASAWLTVDSVEDGLAVYIEPVNAMLLEVQHAAEPAGFTPLREHMLTPGQYRVTLVAPGGESFSEFNAVLMRPGAENQLVLFAQEPGAAAPIKSRPREPHRLVRSTLTTASSAAADPGMVEVPAGTYHFGWFDTPGDQFSRRTVELDAFLIDRDLVTNAQYKAFIDATGYPAPRPWQLWGYKPEYGALPAAGISMLDAEAYAAWVGKRLPTALEWQAAARGAEGRLYPWGNTFDKARASAPSVESLLSSRSLVDQDHFNLYIEQTTRAALTASVPDSRELRQTFGPLLEYTGSLTEGRGGVILVGRAWNDIPERVNLSVLSSYPVDAFAYHGFRCAKSLTPAGRRKSSTEGTS